jgi:hypothetical protein
MTYQCEATSVAGFIQQLAVAYVAHEYYFYVQGMIPDDKAPESVDVKIIAQYGINMSKWTRCRKRREGVASVQYLRYERSFVILATAGEHPFFAAEAGQIRDIRKQPIHFAGYSIGYRLAYRAEEGHASVRIDRQEHRKLKEYFDRLAVYCTVEELEHDLRTLPYEPYAPVRNQLRVILRSLNRRRKAAALPPISAGVLRLRRSPVSVFGWK